MSLISFQTILAKLCIDLSFQKLFFIDPNIVLSEFELTENEKGALKQINKKQLELYLQSLVSKRFYRVEHVFKFTIKLLGKKTVKEEFQKYIQLNMANKFKRDNEIKNFSKYLQESSKIIKKSPNYFIDLLKYEVLIFLASTKRLEDLDDEEL